MYLSVIVLLKEERGGMECTTGGKGGTGRRRPLLGEREGEGEGEGLEPGGRNLEPGGEEEEGAAAATYRLIPSRGPVGPQC